MTPSRIFEQYGRGVSYNRRIGLYEQVKKNENFYIGRQWEGLNAPDLNKPVINVLKRVVSYFISMIVSDDVAVSLSPFRKDPDSLRGAKILQDQVEEVIELANVKSLCRRVIRDAAVDGDGYLYFYFDPQEETGQRTKGRICAEALENVNVIFANPYSSDLQAQPYILIAMRCEPDSVRREAQEWGGDTEGIRPDSDSDRYDISGSAGDGLVTVVLKLWREGGSVHAIKVTQHGVVRPAWDTGCKRYPIAGMCWEQVKNSYHGMAAVTGAIPNQISINQLFAMAIHSVKTTAFPKIIFDRTKLRGWSNKVGQAIGVVGNPNDAVASGFRGGDMSPQLMGLIEMLIQNTLEFMGASDAALGTVEPDNTSAIIATQKASSMPLELQRMEFYRFTEDYVRIILDIIRATYGVRQVAYEENGNTVVQEFDLSAFDAQALNLKIDVGAAAYWSEVMQVQTLDNLFSKGIIPDAISYLESIPDTYIRGKHRLIEKLKELPEKVSDGGEVNARV